MRDGSGSERSPLAACGRGHRRPPLHLHRPRRCSSAQRRLSPALFIDLQMWARPRRWSRNRFQGVSLDGCFKCLVLSGKVLRQGKSTVICYVYVGRSHFCTPVCNATRSSGFGISATFGVFVAWKDLQVCAFTAS